MKKMHPFNTLLSFIILISIFNYSCTNIKPADQNTSNDFIILKNETITLKVDANTGGRIASLRYKGEELLSQIRDKNDWYWGSTIWPSPQADWNWPPPEKMDKAPYTIKSQTSDYVALESPKNAFKNIRLSKAINLSEPNTVRLYYTFYNYGDTTINVGIWENTRIDYHGRVSWETGELIKDEVKNLVQRDSISYLDLEGHEQAQKLFIKSQGGWISYQKNSVRLTKKFEVIPADLIAPEQAAIEVYFDPINHFAELEEHGPYVALAPKTGTMLEVLWILD